MHSRYPVWLRAIGKPSAEAFATIFFLESCARALLSTLIVLEIRTVTGSAQATSMVFFGVALTGLCFTFLVPGLASRIGRRWVYSIGGLLLVISSLLFVFHELETTIAGQALRVYGVICFNICLNLYVLDHLKGAQLNRLEPLRMTMAAAPWTIGPGLGVTLAEDFGPDLPYFVSIGFTFLLLTYFWILRAQENSPLQKLSQPLKSPIAYVPSFFARPRMRLSYCIVIMRSTFWSMFFIYTPIYCVENGLGAQTGGYIVSAGNAFLFLSPLVGLAIKRFGVKINVVASFAFMAVGGIAAFFFADWPWVAAGALLFGTIGAVISDVAGNLPFLRLVKPSERQTMTPIYATYREFSDSVPPGIFSLLLLKFALPVVFLATGIAMAATALYTTRLPKRL